MAASTSRSPGRASTGFTLIEVCVVIAVVGVLAAVSWPSFHDSITRARRADAVVALTRLQWAQEAFMSNHGLYAGQLSSLAGAGAGTSPEGLYAIALRGDGAAGYEASATARADGLMTRDEACAVMTLRVQDGVAHFAPTARCWNR